MPSTADLTIELQFDPHMDTLEGLKLRVEAQGHCYLIIDGERGVVMASLAAWLASPQARELVGKVQR